ncbi:hypothetical protein FRC17_011203, partial [Serendipita sp. 399]
MFVSIVALSIILSGIGTMTHSCNAARIPVRRAVAAEDVNASLRIVDIITCTPLDGATGRLMMKNTPGTTTSAGASLPDEGVPLGLVNQQLMELSSSDDSQAFSFENCTSGFMGLTPSKNVYFGHLVLAGDPNPCLVSTPGATAPQDINTEKCRISDDSGQMLQFWQLTLSEDGALPASLNFVGISKRLNSSIAYKTVFEGQEGARAAQ